MATLVDANTNRLSGFGYSYDGNGNLLTMPQQSASMTYDGSNRMVTFTNQNDTESYQYAPDNKRVWRSKGCSYQSVVDGSTQVASALTFYSVFGQKLGDYCYPPGGGQVVEENVHFGGRIVAKGGAGGSLAALATDRLHSKGDGSTFFPYGETKSGAALTGDSFATYSRDWSGLDYADQRAYSPSMGRYNTVDPALIALASPGKNNNGYSYGAADPINNLDASGEFCFTVESVDGEYMFVPNTLSPFAQCRDERPHWGSARDLEGFCQYRSSFMVQVPECFALPWFVVAVADYQERRENRDRECLPEYQALPATGPGYYSYTTPANSYGLSGLISDIQNFASSWNASNPGFEIGVGHISRNGGGPFPPHSGHRRGIEIDFRPFRIDGAHSPVNIADERNYDRERTRAFVSALINYTGFVSSIVNAILFNDTQITGVRSYAGHDDHLHVKFSVFSECGWIQ